ncbi:MAG: hypothetical protein A2Y65_10120 [Deltaproteobacteria bacterium RBG_13_52_11]|nr:MAG: hypothetical protein A2Y65_10120 [Deltaproteobacteria bacterium RBG_13_52_11]
MDLTGLRMLVIIIGTVLGGIIAGRKKRIFHLKGAIIGGIIAVILVEIVLGVLRGLGFLR